MIKKVFLASAILLQTAITASAQDPNFQIYLCFGQSNMEGAPSTDPLDAVEGDLCDKIVEQLSEDIMNATIANW